MIDRVHSLRRLGSDTRGLTSVEYAIVLALIAAAAVAGWSRFGDDVGSYLQRANVAIRDQLTPGKEER